MLPEDMGGEGDLPEVRGIFLWRDDANLIHYLELEFIFQIALF